MSDLMHYFQAQEETRTARAERQAASYKLELCQIKERAAEFKSQHEPAATIANEKGTDRDKMLAAIHFVLFGRLPK